MFSFNVLFIYFSSKDTFEKVSDYDSSNDSFYVYSSNVFSIDSFKDSSSVYSSNGSFDDSLNDGLYEYIL